MDDKCANCSKTGSLKRCAKCRTTQYCSRECQKLHWKAHKKVCADNGNVQAKEATSATKSFNNNNNNATRSTSSTAAGGSSSSSSAKTSAGPLRTQIRQPFHKLHAKQWLHDRDPKDVYMLLIDAYRFRVEDDYVLEGDISDDSLYGGGDPVQGFKRFLEKARTRFNGTLLPPWWDKAKSEFECLTIGKNSSGDNYLGHAVEKHDIINFYKENLMPMQLRMFAEQVLGRGPGGQSGDAMMQMQMMSEKGEGPPFMSTLDTSSILRQFTGR
ncbi:hypothetical protein BG004_003023 [Podila humilis]|nr:hypothetical protein BG004_003023 [Podila humilis]